MRPGWCIVFFCGFCPPGLKGFIQEEPELLFIRYNGVPAAFELYSAKSGAREATCHSSKTDEDLTTPLFFNRTPIGAQKKCAYRAKLFLLSPVLQYLYISLGISIKKISDSVSKNLQYRYTKLQVCRIGKQILNRQIEQSSYCVSFSASSLTICKQRCRSSSLCHLH